MDFPSTSARMSPEDGAVLQIEPSRKQAAGQLTLVDQVVSTVSGPVIPNETRIRTQKPLEEEDYVDGLTHVIKRDFFPELFSRDQQRQRMLAWQSLTEDGDPDNLPQEEDHLLWSGEASRTPNGTLAMDTPLSMVQDGVDGHSGRISSSVRIPHGMSLSEYQSTYTSEDNDSFLDIVHRENVKRRRELAWAYVATRKSNIARLRLTRVVQKTIQDKPSQSLSALHLIEAHEAKATGEDIESVGERSDALQMGPPTSGISKIMQLKDVGNKAEAFSPASEPKPSGPTSRPMPHTYSKTHNRLYFPSSTEESPIFPESDVKASFERASERGKTGISHKNTRFRTRRPKLFPDSPSSSRLSAAVRDDLSFISGDRASSSKAPSVVMPVDDERSEEAATQTDTTLMTWGTVDSTPIVLNRPHERAYALPNSSKRDQLHRRLASDKSGKQARRLSPRETDVAKARHLDTPVFSSYSPRYEMRGNLAGARTPVDRRQALTPAARALMSKLPGS